MKQLISALAALAILTGCGGTDSVTAIRLDDSDAGDASPGVSRGSPQVPVTESRAGEQLHVVLESNVDGEDISFELYEPDQLVAGESYPLVLQGHGYGGSRTTSRSGFIARLTEAGYYVISIDQRGFGEAGGTVRVLSPDFEGQDLIQILDWAEDLPGLARRADDSMLVGSYGSSYGGGYQFLLYAADPQHRLRVLAPDITWHDLRDSLNPNSVIKSGWALALVAAGEQGSAGNQDVVIREMLSQGGSTNDFPEAGLNFFQYHSPNYYCTGQPAGPQDFLVGTPDPLGVDPILPPAADILITQGMRDTLFTFNEAFNNYRCFRNLGGDVRLLTHETGHILPVSTAQGGFEEQADALSTAVTFPGFQDPGGSRSCGGFALDDVQFAWFEEKLQGKQGALDAALTTGAQVCMSLAEGDAVVMPDVLVGGVQATLNGSIPQLSGPVGVVGSVAGNGAREALLSVQPLFTVPEDTDIILAGVPTLSATLSGLSGFEQSACLIDPAQAGCDPIVFVGIGHRKAGQSRWDLVDDQLTPLRSFGGHEIEMIGVAERLKPGDSLGLMIYAFHGQYPITWSRDVLVPAMTINGTVGLPLVLPNQVSAVPAG